MKTFQKITLAAAISAAPFMAQADLTPMSESLMGDTTGQAGVTIEIDLGDDGIKVGSVVYTDTAHGIGAEIDDTNGAAPGDAGYISTYATYEDGGSVALENISVNLTGTLVQTIDVSKTGDLEMTVSSPGALTVAMGNDAADVTGQFSALKLQAVDGSESEIINNLDLSMNLGSSTTTIRNLGNGTAASAGLGALANAGVTGDYATGVSSMAIEMNASFEITDMNLGVFGYTNAQANILGQGHDTSVTAKATLDGAATTGVISYDAATGEASSTEAGDALFVGTYNGTLNAVKNKIATGSAIQVEGVTIEAAAGGAIALNQVIWAVGGDASEAGSKAGVYIQLGAMDMNIGVESIAIGGSSIGSLAVNGLELGGMTQRIYGH